MNLGRPIAGIPSLPGPPGTTLAANAFSPPPADRVATWDPEWVTPRPTTYASDPAAATPPAVIKNPRRATRRARSLSTTAIPHVRSRRKGR